MYEQPGLEGNNWVGQNVDILKMNGLCLSNVHFVMNEVVVPPNPVTGTPGVYNWVYEDYSIPGAPVRRKVSSNDVDQKNYPGSLCKPTPPQVPTTVPTIPPTSIPPTLPTGTCKQWMYNPFTGQPMCIKY